MTVRHARRNIEESARRHVEAYLTSLGWLETLASDRPFHAPGAVSVLTEFLGLDGSRQVAAGTSTPIVSVAIPGDGPDVETEIGGPLVETTYGLFVSVVAAPALVNVLTEDVVDLLAGRTARPLIPFYQGGSPGTLVADETLELQDVSSGRARPDREDWMLVTATIVRTFNRSWQ